MLADLRRVPPVFPSAGENASLRVGRRGLDFSRPSAAAPRLAQREVRAGLAAQSQRRTSI